MSARRAFPLLFVLAITLTGLLSPAAADGVAETGLVLATPSGAPAEVATYRGNWARTSEQPGPGPAGDPVLRWHVQPGGMLYFGIVVAGETVYATAPKTGVLYALDAANGDRRWRAEIGFALGSTVVANVVYAAGGGDLYALDAATGDQRWRLAASNAGLRFGPFAPAVVDGTIYVSGSDPAGNTLYAFDAATRKERWRAATADAAVAPPAVAGGAVFAATAEAFLAFDAATGAERWHVAVEPSLVPPVVAGDLALLATAGALIAVDAATGREHWRLTSTSIVPAPAVTGSVVYVSTVDDLVALDQATGRERWRVDLERGVYCGEPAIAEGVLYVGCSDGALRAYESATGAERWRFATGLDHVGPPVVAGGAAYVVGNPQDQPFLDLVAVTGSRNSTA